MKIPQGLKDWGWKGVGQSALEGVGWTVGFQQVEGQGLRFLGGKGIREAGRQVITGGLAAIGVGMATGVPAAGMATGFLAGGPLVMPLMTAYDMYQGFKEGGVGGAIKSGVTSVAMGAAFNVAFKAGRVLLANSALASIGLPLATVAGIGYGSIKVMQALAEKGRSIERTNFLADTTAYYTNAALTTRQRAIQEISRASINANLYLGQEAKFMHDVARPRIGYW